jgi:hypothetical protein
MRAMLFAFILFLPVAAHATTAQELATSQLDRLNAVCPDPLRISMTIKNLNELKASANPEDWRILFAFEQTKWAEFVHSPACETALRQNTVDGTDFFLATQPADSRWRDIARKDEAEALLQLAVTGDDAEKASRIAKAADLFKTNFEAESHATKKDDLAKSMAYYFAAHAYLSAAKLATRPDDTTSMIATALSTARIGMAKATDTSEIVEPYGIALGETARRAPNGSPERRKALEESIRVFSTVSEHDPLAAYNIAVDHILLDDLPAAKADLQALADAHRIDNEVCMGIITDADLAPLRDAERDWTIQLVRAQCKPTLERLSHLPKRTL